MNSNNPHGLPNVSYPPVDIKDPRIRITFADVAMKLVSDGPMYGVIVLMGILAATKNIEGIHAIFGCAFALQARSKPPETDKLDRIMRTVAGGVSMMIPVLIALVMGGIYVSCMWETAP